MLCSQVQFFRNFLSPGASPSDICGSHSSEHLGPACFFRYNVFLTHKHGRKRILRTGFILYFKSRWESINMSHLDIPACSRKHQHQCQFEWNREKAGSSHSLNLLFKVLTHYQWVAPSPVLWGWLLAGAPFCLLSPGPFSPSGDDTQKPKPWASREALQMSHLYRWTQHFIFQHRDRGKPTWDYGHTVSGLLPPHRCENSCVRVGYRAYV